MRKKRLELSIFRRDKAVGSRHIPAVHAHETRHDHFQGWGPSVGDWQV